MTRDRKVEKIFRMTKVTRKCVSKLSRNGKRYFINTNTLVFVEKQFLRAALTVTETLQPATDSILEMLKSH